MSESAIDPLADGAAVLERLREQPGGRELLELAGGREDVYLVGGAVRDLLLGVTPRELDVALERAHPPFGHEAALFAGELAASLGTLAGDEGAPVNAHERFGTMLVRWGARGEIDIAATRRERYPHPGALPEVEAATLGEDLRRRDFTVNAIAVRLGGIQRGKLDFDPRALGDLQARRLRVLHDASFMDDPTRLLRLVRYRVRLGFTVEERTEALAREALSAGALRTVSGARIGAELRLALGEPDPLAVLAALADIGVLGALSSDLRLQEPLVRRALDLLAPAADERMDVLLLSALVLPLALRTEGDPGAEIRALLDRLEFPGAERDRVLAATAAVPSLLEELPRRARPSELYELASPVRPEAVALAGALDAEAADAARRWLGELRHVRPAITGADLLAEGIPEGPEIGRRLRATLLLRLDGELAPGREAELRAALELA